MNRMLSSESFHSSAFSRSNSQASVDSASMEDFWREIESIKESHAGRQEGQEEQEEQTPAEVKPVEGRVLDLLSSVLTICSFVLLAGRNHPTSSLTSESIQFDMSAACSRSLVCTRFGKGGFCVRWHDLNEGCQQNSNWSLSVVTQVCCTSCWFASLSSSRWLFWFWWLCHLYTWLLITAPPPKKRDRK